MAPCRGVDGGSFPPLLLALAALSTVTVLLLPGRALAQIEGDSGGVGSDFRASSAVAKFLLLGAEHSGVEQIALALGQRSDVRMNTEALDTDSCPFQTVRPESRADVRQYLNMFFQERPCSRLAEDGTVGPRPDSGGGGGGFCDRCMQVTKCQSGCIGPQAERSNAVGFVASDLSMVTFVAPVLSASNVRVVWVERRNVLPGILSSLYANNLATQQVREKGDIATHGSLSVGVLGSGGNHLRKINLKPFDVLRMIEVVVTQEQMFKSSLKDLDLPSVRHMWTDDLFAQDPSQPASALRDESHGPWRELTEFIGVPPSYGKPVVLPGDFDAEQAIGNYEALRRYLSARFSVVHES